MVEIVIVMCAQVVIAVLIECDVFVGLVGTLLDLAAMVHMKLGCT